MRVFLLRLSLPVFWLVLATLAVGGILLAVVIFFYGPKQTIERIDADVNHGDIWSRNTEVGDKEASVWLYTPYIAPGDRVSLEVGVYRRALAIAVNRVKGTFAGHPFQRGGRGRAWGFILSTSGMGTKRAF